MVPEFNNLRGVFVMAEAATKLPIKTEAASASQVTKASDWQPFEALRNQVDRLFHDFQTGFLRAPSYRSLLDIEPFWRRDFSFDVTPAIDIVEKDKAFEVTAELPGLDVKNIEVQLSDNVLTIKGEKQEEKEEKAKDRYVSERRYGSFRRARIAGPVRRRQGRTVPTPQPVRGPARARPQRHLAATRVPIPGGW